MKEAFKKKLQESPEIIDTVDMQMYALTHFMALLGFEPRRDDFKLRHNEGQHGYLRIVSGGVKQYMSFGDALAMYNGSAVYKAKAGLFALRTPKGNATITFIPEVLRAADKARIFEVIGLHYNKKSKKMLSTKKLLKFVE